MLVFLFSFLHFGSVSSWGSEWPSLETERGTLSIIWRCASTVVLSAWMTARPNAVLRGEAWWERVKLMIGIILAPELVLVWAIKHLYSAKHIKSMFEGWTLAHAYFLIMGGFSVLDQHQKFRILTLEDFSRGFSVQYDDDVLTFDPFRGFSFQRKGDATFDPRLGFSVQHNEDDLTFDPRRGFSPRASENPFQSFMQKPLSTIILGETSGRSKVDWLLQLIAIPYALWFVVQYGARVYFGLAITELEFATLVLVFFHAILYGVSWHKPIGVWEDSRPTAAKFGTGNMVSEAVRRYWQECQWLQFSSFFLVPILIFSSVFQSMIRLGLILFYIFVSVDEPSSARNRGLVARIISAILNTRRGVTELIRLPLTHTVDPTNYTIFISESLIVLPVYFALIPIAAFPLFVFILLLLDPTDVPEEVKFAETSEYILKTFRRIILATLHFSEKGLVGLVNTPVLCIGFVLLFALSPFALAITVVLHFTNTTEFESTDSKSTILEAHQMVISGTHTAQKKFKHLLKAPDRSQFGVTYYILFIPLMLLVTLLFLVGCLFDLLFLVDQSISSMTQTLITDSFNPGATEVPIFYAPFPKGGHHPCLITATVVGLTFFGLQCIGWDFQLPCHSKLQMSWRITCLAISAIPVIAIPLILIMREEKDIMILQEERDTLQEERDILQEERDILLQDSEEESDIFLQEETDAFQLNPRKESSIIQILQWSKVIARFLFLVYLCARVSLIPQAIMLLMRRQPNALVSRNNINAM